MRKTVKLKRFTFLIAMGAVLALAVGLILSAFQETIVYFKSPTDIVALTPSAQRFRVGGLVQNGSVARHDAGKMSFSVTDGANEIAVQYQGVVPDLFREGQGVVIEGKWTDQKVFVADSLLARHDENYMPPEVAKALRDSGHWKGEGNKK